MSCEFALDDAAYVLGALPPEERLAFERHLATCDECSRSVQQIAGLPGLLAQVPLDIVESPPPPVPLPDTLLPALVREVRRSQLRRRWVAGLAAAAAVVVVGAASVAIAGSGDDQPSAGPSPSASPSASAAPARQMEPVDQDAVAADVALTSVAWGTRLDLVCSYASPPAEYHGTDAPTYALVVRSIDGKVQQVATWRALPGKTMHLTGATALTTDDIASVEVLASDGHPVLELAG